MSEELKPTPATTKKTSQATSPAPMSRSREEIHPDFKVSFNEDAHAIPEDVTRRFKKDGYTLSWVRYRIGEKEDYSNIARKGKQGWVFVAPGEVPELASATQMQSFGRYSDLVTIEDVALAKCKTKYVEELKKLKAERARSQIKAEEAKLDRAGVNRESSSRVSHGTKRPTFDNDEGNEE